jgi:hypothetical protein
MPMDRTANAAAIPRDYRALRAILGALAMIAAVAAGAGTAITAALFGALIALGLSAGTGLAALLEAADADPWRGGRGAAWVALGLGWIVAAALLLYAPIEHREVLRALVSGLVAGGAVMRAAHWRSRSAATGIAAAGTAAVASCALLALAVLWGGGWLPAGDPAAAVSVGCAIELFGTGMLWLGEGVFLHGRDAAARIVPPLRAGAMQMA